MCSSKSTSHSFDWFKLHYNNFYKSNQWNLSQMQHYQFDSTNIQDDWETGRLHFTVHVFSKCRDFRHTPTPFCARSNTTDSAMFLALLYMSTVYTALRLSLPSRSIFIRAYIHPFIWGSHTPLGDTHCHKMKDSFQVVKFSSNAVADCSLRSDHRRVGQRERQTDRNTTPNSHWQRGIEHVSALCAGHRRPCPMRDTVL